MPIKSAHKIDKRIEIESEIDEVCVSFFVCLMYLFLSKYSFVLLYFCVWHTRNNKQNKTNLGIKIEPQTVGWMHTTEKEI